MLVQERMVGMRRRERRAVTPQRRSGAGRSPGEPRSYRSPAANTSSNKGTSLARVPRALGIGLTETAHWCALPHHSNLLQWTLRACLPILQDVGTHLCGAEVLVAEKFPYCSDVRALLQQVSCNATVGRFTERRRNGNTYCHLHSDAAFGYFWPGPSAWPPP
jgi:hypothetical protein